jgi:multiple sugar transport system ATP-binding protein
MGTTIVYVTHDQIEAMTLATQIAVMNEGRVDQMGTPAEVYNDPTTLFVADFMGSPAMNLIPAEVRVNGGPTAVALAREGEEPLVLPVGDGDELRSYQGREVIFGIRPEAITDADGADRRSQRVITAECQVEVVEPAGSDTYVVSRIGGKELIARMRADLALAPGDRMPFAFDMQKAVFFDRETERRIV